jgi:hypothetical protein
MSAAAAAAFFALTMSAPAQAGMMMNPGLPAAAPPAVQQVGWHHLHGWHRHWHRHYRHCWRDWRGFRHCSW